jgi:hypothetical protein
MQELQKTSFCFATWVFVYKFKVAKRKREKPLANPSFNFKYRCVWGSGANSPIGGSSY